MSLHLHHDLENLKKQLLSISALAEEAAWKAIQSLIDRRPENGLEVVEGDAEIDALEVEIEESCLKILALHQPVAVDLRFVAAVMKINNDIERVGDLAVNIAKRGRFLSNNQPIPLPKAISHMSEVSLKMLRGSLDAFMAQDAEKARSICAMDQIVDDCNKDVRREMQNLMRSDPETIERAVSLINVSRNLERIADHATNIGEDVVYLVEGEIVRHPNYPENQR